MLSTVLLSWLCLTAAAEKPDDRATQQSSVLVMDLRPIGVAVEDARMLTAQVVELLKAGIK